MTINEVVIVGRLARDPELRHTTNGKPVCGFTVAVDRYMGKDNENEADFIPVVAWNSTAEFISKYFSKGKKIIVKGNLRQRSWEDNDGKKHYVLEVWAEKVDFADGKKEVSGESTKNSNSNFSHQKNKGEQTTSDNGSGTGNKPPWMQG